jgi:hypothetical protein
VAAQPLGKELDLNGVTWKNVLSDQFTGLNGIATPGTLRDSMVLLVVVHEQ